MATKVAPALPVATEPWKEEGSPWKSESQFLTWVRGVLRKGWSKHPIKLEYIKRNRKRIKNPKNNPRFPEVWGMTCGVCQHDKVQAEIEIDHISETGGTFKKLEDAVEYMRHLFMVNFSKMRAVCKDCHKAITLSQRKQISLEDAFSEKKVTEFLKKGKQEVLAFCKKYGYSEASLTNADKRKIALTAIFKEHKL